MMFAGPYTFTPPYAVAAAGSRKPRISKADLLPAGDICKAYKLGVSAPELAAAYEVTPYIIYRLLRLHGAPVRPQGGADAWRLLNATAARDRQIIALYQNGWTLQEVGDAVGLTRERVRQILRHWDVPKPSRCNVSEARRPAREAADKAREEKAARVAARASRREAIIAAYEAGDSLESIARRWFSDKAKIQAVWNTLHRWGVSPRSKRA
jgi:uncharacterized protein (DUF433 family)